MNKCQEVIQSQAFEIVKYKQRNHEINFSTLQSYLPVKNPYSLSIYPYL